MGLSTLANRNNFQEGFEALNTSCYNLTLMLNATRFCTAEIC